MAGPSIGTWVKVRNKSGRTTARVIAKKFGGGAYEQGQVITQSEYNAYKERRAEAKSGGASTQSPRFDKSKPKLRKKAEFESAAEQLSSMVKGKTVSFSQGGVSFEFKLNGVQVWNRGKGDYLLIADVQGGKNLTADRPMRRVSDPALARRIYTKAVGLPDDVPVGGKVTRYKNQGSFLATTSSGEAISATPGIRTVVDLGLQAVDYPLRK